MNLIDYAISHARVFFGILIFIIAAGSSTYISIPKEAVPDVNIPIIYVSLSQKGISANDFILPCSWTIIFTILLEFSFILSPIFFR